MLWTEIVLYGFCIRLYGIDTLLTQREALDARIDLLEIKLKQFESKVGLYRALGGGW